MKDQVETKDSLISVEKKVPCLPRYPGGLLCSALSGLGYVDDLQSKTARSIKLVLETS